jgi:hypothetical protein
MPASNLCRGDEASGLPLCLLVPFSGLFVTILVAIFLLVLILLPLPALGAATDFGAPVQEQCG